jgi:hypothetical protein
VGSVPPCFPASTSGMRTWPRSPTPARGRWRPRG